MPTNANPLTRLGRGFRLAKLTLAVLCAVAMFGTACATAEPTVTPEPTPAPATATPLPVASINTPSESSRAETIDEMMNEPIAPFTNIAPLVLVDPETGEDLWMIENRHPGVAIFDYDRDGDMDLYVTSAESEALLPDTTGGPIDCSAMKAITSSPRSPKRPALT